MVSRNYCALVVVFVLSGVLSASIFAAYPQARSSTIVSSTATSTTVTTVTPTQVLYPNWGLFTYNGGLAGSIQNGTAVVLPYPTVVASGNLAGSDAQPNPDNSSYYRGFGFRGIFAGCPVGVACSRDVYDNMAVWLHTNESNYNYPEFGFTYRFGGACAGLPGSHAAVFGYVQWGNGNPSRNQENCIRVESGTNAEQNYFMTVSSVREPSWTTGSCKLTQCFENTFRYYVDGKLAGTIRTPQPYETLASCLGFQCYSYFDYEGATYYVHAATHMYSSGVFSCGDCSLTVSNLEFEPY